MKQRLCNLNGWVLCLEMPAREKQEWNWTGNSHLRWIMKHQYCSPWQSSLSMWSYRFQPQSHLIPGSPSLHSQMLCSTPTNFMLPLQKDLRAKGLQLVAEWRFDRSTRIWQSWEVSPWLGQHARHWWSGVRGISKALWWAQDCSSKRCQRSGFICRVQEWNSRLCC